jgi:2,4-dienoyl-CoA reductase-like NADH-dependent reductase (Old Yellow Enzyme family)
MAPKQTEKLLAGSRIGNLSLGNRFIKAGCFEGMSQGGGVTDQLIEHHRRIAEGQVAMTTVAYCSVSFDGRAFEHEMWMRKEIIPDLKRLVVAAHKEGAAVSIQLGHCGYFANKQVIRKRPMGASPKFNLFQLSYCKEMTEEDIHQKVEDFGRSALLAKEAGFDAIEIHAGHGYLLSQFLSPYTNHRRDKYGGSLENRMQFPAMVIRRIRELVGSEYPILVKMNQFEGMRRGLELPEAIEFAQMFEKNGASALIPSCGFTSKTPLYMLRGNVPTREMIKNQKNWISKIGLFLFGKFLVQQYPFERLFLMDGAEKIKNAVSIPVIYVGGIRDEKDINRLIEKGFDFMQLGRTLIHDPDFVKNLSVTNATETLCDACNRCVAAMDAGGVYCVSKEKGYLV